MFHLEDVEKRIINDHFDVGDLKLFNAVNEHIIVGVLFFINELKIICELII